MASWLTQDGLYYESEFKIQQSDLKVPQRPGSNFHFINGSWVAQRLDEGEYSPEEVHVHRIQLKPNPHSLHHPNEPIYHEAKYHHPAYQVIPEKAPEPKENKDSVVLNNNTKVMFGVREIFMIGAFVVTATISWQDTNARIMKLEDNKAFEMLDSKIKSIEIELKALDKQTRTENQKLEQTIREIEQVVFMKTKH